MRVNLSYRGAQQPVCFSKPSEGADLVESLRHLVAGEATGSRQLFVKFRQIPRFVRRPRGDRACFQHAKPPINMVHFRQVERLGITPNDTILELDVTRVPAVLVA
jgi:hypothetical protein